MFKIIKTGLLTTVQDLGRIGYQKYGLATSGAVDSYAHRMANILVGNSDGDATLEVTLMGLQLEVIEDCIIAITGGNFNPCINHIPVPMWTTIKVNKGDILAFIGYTSGCRAYIAVAGGIQVEEFLGSKSTDTISGVGGIEGRGLEKGDIIHTNGTTRVKSHNNRSLSPNIIPTYPDNIKVRVLLGPQDDAFTSKGLETFFSSEYIVSKDSDRMACRLEGPKVEHTSSADILSEGMFQGAIQVPKNGLPILFQAGRQSVGGYTKIGGVITVDQSKVAQLKPRDRITFEKVTLQEAHALLRNQERLFQTLKVHS
jgi:antagonist of KipI